MATTPRKTRAAGTGTETPVRRKSTTAATPVTRRAEAAAVEKPTRARKTSATATASEAPARARRSAAPADASTPKRPAAASAPARPRTIRTATSAATEAAAPAPVRKLRSRGPSAVAVATDGEATPRRRARTLTTPADAAPAKKPRSKPAAEVEVPETPKRHRAKVGEAILSEETGKKIGRARKPASRTPTPFEQIEQLKQTVLAALEDLKARDLLVLDVRPLTSMFDFRIIVTGTSNRHLSSMAEEVAKRAKAIGMPPMYISGDRESDWVLVDLGDIVVDLMSEQARAHYALEKLWSVPAAPATA